MAKYTKGQKQPKKTANNSKNSIKYEKKADDSKTNSGSSGSFYYSFLTIILLLCLVQITISAVLNISKIVSYKAKIIQIKNTKNAALALNEQLKDNIKNFSNVTSMEAIARNNLKMSSEDEVMVIINTPNDNETKEKPKKFVFWRN